MNRLIMILMILMLGLTSVGQDDDYNSSESYNDEYILKNGFFLDGILQAGTFSYYSTPYHLLGNSYNYPSTSVALRLGNTWYFGNMNIYRPGIAVTWFRGGALFATTLYGDLNTILNIAPVNIGFANALSFGGEIGLEVNINFGFNMNIDLPPTYLVYNGINPGFLFNPTVKFRYKKLAVGLDITYFNGTYIRYNYIESASTLFGLTIGFKT